LLAEWSRNPAHSAPLREFRSRGEKRAGFLFRTVEMRVYLGLLWASEYFHIGEKIVGIFPCVGKPLANIFRLAE
jgi:hypothetical protein